MSEAKPLHKAGTKILAEDGSLVATLTCDVFVGDIMLASHFILADGSQPKPGDAAPRAIAKFING